MIADFGVAVVQVLVVGMGAPLLVGVLRALKARLVGRRGPSPWQPYADLRKLLGKEVVVSTTTSWVFRATPYVLVATMLVTALIVPVSVARPPLAFAGNIILLVYLFMLGTFFLALAGLDAGSAFGGWARAERSPSPRSPSRRSSSPCSRSRYARTRSISAGSSSASGRSHGLLRIPPTSWRSPRSSS